MMTNVILLVICPLKALHLLPYWKWKVLRKARRIFFRFGGRDGW